MRTVIERVALGVLFALVMLLPPAVHAAPNFTEGQWEMQGEVKFEGEMKIEGKAIPLKSMPIHYTKCLTKKDMVPNKEEKNQKCTRTEKITGNTVSWTVKCTDAKGMVIESTGSGVYSNTTFEGKARNVMTNPQGEKTIANMTMKGRRTGPCK